MITEFITFAIPSGMTREQLMENYRRSAPNWRANPDLLAKNYLFDPAAGLGGGVYLWKSMDAAKRARDEAWMKRVRETYGSEPSIRYFETPIAVDNLAARTLEGEAAASLK